MAESKKKRMLTFFRAAFEIAHQSFQFFSLGCRGTPEQPGRESKSPVSFFIYSKQQIIHFKLFSTIMLDKCVGTQKSVLGPRE